MINTSIINHLSAKKMPIYHILNGDCLTEQLKQTTIGPNFIVCRECLIEGGVSANNMTDFWNIRAKFIADTYKISEEEYFHKTVNEFEKLNQIPDYSEVCLWFENDLFCQVNMWFTIAILSKYPTLKIFRIFPVIENKADRWKGFGIANAEKLDQAYNTKIQFTAKDIELGENLWKSYQSSDFIRLKQLSKQQTNCFKYLEEVCKAHIDRFPSDKTLGRPEKVIKETIDSGIIDFHLVFSEFSDREGIYGFGDSQIRNIYDKLIL